MGENMADKERESNGYGGFVGSDGQRVDLKIQNGFTAATDNYKQIPYHNSVGSSSNTLRTYKRRKKNNTHDEKVSESLHVQVNDKFTNEISHVDMDKLSTKTENISNIGAFNSILASDGALVKQKRNDCLQQMFTSLEGGNGLRECIQDAHVLHSESSCSRAVKESIHSCEDLVKCAALSLSGPHQNVTFSASQNIIDDRRVTKLCQRAFSDVITSDKFAHVCCLLECFGGTKAHMFSVIAGIDSRMKEGVYETSPVLFLSDTEQLWMNLLKVGSDFVSIANCLLETSRAAYHQQVKDVGDNKLPENGNTDCVYPTDMKTSLKKADMIDLDNLPELVMPVSKKNKKVKLKQNKNKYGCGKYIKDEVYQSLKEKMNSTDNLWETIWSACEDSNRIVTMEDMTDILDEKYLSTQLVDAFILMMQRSPDFNKDLMFFMPSTCWIECRYSWEAKKETNKFVELFVKHGREGSKLVLFPICSPGYSQKRDPMHWTLLTFDGREDGSWNFYNPMKPSKLRSDFFLADARKMKKYLESTLPTPKNVCGRPRENPMDIKNVQDTPQQGAGMNECALYVMHFIHRLIQGKQIDDPANYMNKFKAGIIEMFTNDTLDVDLDA